MNGAAGERGGAGAGGGASAGRSHRKREAAADRSGGGGESPPPGSPAARKRPGRGTRPAVELSPGVEWIAECFPVSTGHRHVSVFLVRARGGNVVIDSGSFHHRRSIRERLEGATGDDGLSALILSHSDYPHSGNIPDFRERWGDIDIVASSSDPEIQGLPYARRSRIGETLDVCGREFLFLDPPLADRSHTTWIYDTEARIVFAADGFGNLHRPGECDLTSDRIPGGIRTDDLHRFHAEELVWLRFVDPPKLRRALERTVAERPVEWIAPVHGNPIHRNDLDDYLERLMEAVEEIAGGARGA